MTVMEKRSLSVVRVGERCDYRGSTGSFFVVMD